MKLFILLSIAAVAVTGQSFCTCNEKYTGSDCSDCAIDVVGINAVDEHLFQGYWNTTEGAWMEKPVLGELRNGPFGGGVQWYKETVWMKIDGASWAEENIVDLATQVVTESFKRDVCLPDVDCQIIGFYNASDPLEANAFVQRKIQFLRDPETLYPIYGIDRSNSTNPPARSLVINKIYASRVYGTNNFYIPVMEKKSGCALSQSNLQYGADLNLRAYLQEQKYVRETLKQIECYGQGNWDSASHKCQCARITQDEDKFCGECTGSFINWPQCDESPCDGANTCSGHGRCDKSDEYTSFLGFGVNSYSTAYQWTSVNHNNFLLKGANQGKYCSGKSAAGVQIMWLLDPNNGRKCCNTDDRFKGYCEWDEDCAGGRVCIKSGYEACSRTPPGGGNTEISGCSPAQSCCHGQCCDSNEACQEIEGGRTGIDNINLGPGLDQSTVVRMEWNFQGSEIPEDYRYKCTAVDTMDAAAAIRSWVTPFLIMLAVGTSTILVMTTGGFDLGEKKITIPALIVICSSFFLIFSRLQTFAIVASLGSILALGVQKSQSPNKFLFALLFQFFFLAILGGGLGVGNNLISSPGGGVFGGLDQNDCSGYFGSFRYDPAVTQPWDSGDAYYLHCSEDYLAAVQFFGTVMFCSFFIQTIATGAVMVGQNAK